MRIENYFETQDLAMCAGLLTLGIPFAEPPVNLRTKDGHRTLYYLRETSTDGAINTREMARAWNDPNYVANNPESPLSYIRCAFDNRNALLDNTKHGLDLVVMETNGKLILCSKNAPESFKRDLFNLI